MNRTRATENLAVFVMVAVVLSVVVLMDGSGAPQRWHAAVVGTAVSFGGVALVYQRKWRHWPFWVSLGTCFAAHVLALWLVFDRLLAPVKTMGILIWSPIAFAEGIFLLGLVPFLERKLTHKKQ
jgi:membrane-associated HD superfamily phosphohydrolase